MYLWRIAEGIIKIPVPASVRPMGIDGGTGSLKRCILKRYIAIINTRLVQPINRLRLDSTSDWRSMQFRVYGVAAKWVER